MDWIILRTAGRSTLPLAASLAEDGYEVWTPKRTDVVHVPRMNAKRAVTSPLMAGFVFARAQYLHDLLTLATMPVKPRRGTGLHKPAHADFSIFHDLDRIPLIRDGELDHLRLAEKPQAERRRYGRFGHGSSVRVTKGSFEGMTGMIEECGKDYAMVWLGVFGRHFKAKISTFILKPNDDISPTQAERMPRHRNAAKYLGQSPIVGKALPQECDAMDRAA